MDAGSCDSMGMGVHAVQCRAGWSCAGGCVGYVETPTACSVIRLVVNPVR